MQFIDTHTHLFSNKFDEDIDEVIQRALDAGVYRMMLPDIDKDSTEQMHALADRYPEHCYPMLGLHPCSVNADFETELTRIEGLFESKQRKYWAVGEIGMDLYWDKTFLSQQQEAFSRQIELAKKLELPIVIHIRDCFDEAFEVVDRLNDDRLTGIFHCFSGTEAQAEKILEYGGFKLGMGGVLTFKKSGVDKAIANIGLEHLVLETDSPYLAPTPNRGKRNESSYLIHVAQKLADVKGISLEEVAKVTTQNALEIFKFDA